jgi:hypothetical protein
MASVDFAQNKAFVFLVRRDGTVTDSIPVGNPGGGAWRWSPRGDALYRTSRDSADRRLVGWLRHPVNPTTGKIAGAEVPVLLRESSQIGRFDIADATGEMAVELGNRRHVVWLLTLDRGRYVPRELRASTLPVFASFMPNEQGIVFGTVEGDSTLTVSRLDLVTDQERTLGRVAWGIAGFFELGFPVRSDDARNIILTRRNFSTGNADILRLRPGGGIDTIARAGIIAGEAIPLGAGSVAYFDQAKRVIRAWPGGSRDTLTLADSIPQPIVSVERWGDDGLIAFIAKLDAPQYFGVWTIEWRGPVHQRARIRYEDGQVALGAVGDTVFVAVQSDAGRGVELVAVPLRGASQPGAVAPLPTGALEYPYLQLSADRKRVLVIGTEEFSDIWMIKGALGRRR